MSVRGQKVHLLGDERVVVDAVEGAAVTVVEVNAAVEPTVAFRAAASVAKPVRPQACQKRILTELNRAILRPGPGRKYCLPETAVLS